MPKKAIEDLSTEDKIAVLAELGEADLPAIDARIAVLEVELRKWKAARRLAAPETARPRNGRPKPGQKPLTERIFDTNGEGK